LPSDQLPSESPSRFGGWLSRRDLGNSRGRGGLTQHLFLGVAEVAACNQPKHRETAHAETAETRILQYPKQSDTLKLSATEIAVGFLPQPHADTPRVECDHIRISRRRRHATASPHATCTVTMRKTIHERLGYRAPSFSLLLRGTSDGRALLF